MVLKNFMKSFFTGALLGATLLVSLGNSKCASVHGQIVGNNFKFTIPPQTIEGGGILGTVLKTLDFSFPLETLVPGNVMTSDEISEVYINLIGFRSLVSQDYDSNGEPVDKRIQNPALIGPCSSGQQSIDFIKSFSVYLQKSGTQNKIRIAHFCNSRDPEACAAADMPATTRSGFCGIFVELDEDPATGQPYNLKAFFPSYSVITEMVGVTPVNDVDVSGFIVVDWVSDIELPKQK